MFRTCCYLNVYWICICDTLNQCVYVFLNGMLPVYKAEYLLLIASGCYKQTVLKDSLKLHLSVWCSYYAASHVYCVLMYLCWMSSAPTEQQYFDIDKRLAESQEQILSATRDLQALKEENKKLSEFSQFLSTHHFLPFYWGICASGKQRPLLRPNYLTVKCASSFLWLLNDPFYPLCCWFKMATGRSWVCTGLNIKFNKPPFLGLWAAS